MGGISVPDREKYVEKTAQDIAALLYPWDMLARAHIRRRVQELLRCKDEPTVTIPLTSDPYAPSGYPWRVHDASGRLWKRDDIHHAVLRAPVAIFGTEQPGDWTLIQRTKDAVLKEFGITR